MNSGKKILVKRSQVGKISRKKRAKDANKLQVTGKKKREKVFKARTTRKKAVTHEEKKS